MVKGKILYLSYDGMTDPLGQSQVLPYLTALSKSGFQITIVSAEKQELFEKYADLIRKLCHEYRIKWDPVRYHKAPPVLSTLLDLWTMYRLAKRLILTENISLVHCRSYLPAMLARRLKKRLPVRWIFDMRGFWIDERVEGGVWNLKNPVFRFINSVLKAEERKLILKADHIVSLTQKAVPIIAGQRGNGKEITVIPCCVDTDFFDPARYSDAEVRTEKEKLGLPADAYVIGYLGSYSTWYMPSEMLDFFKSLVEKEPQARFLIITHENPDLFKNLAKSKGVDLERLIFKSASRAEIPLLLKVLDSAVFFIIPTYSKQASSPVKLGEFMSMGIPVVANSGVGDVDNVLHRTELGVLIRTFDTHSYSEAAKEILKFKNRNAASGIREAALESISLNSGIKEYLHVYNRFFTANRDGTTHS